MRSFQAASVFMSTIAKSQFFLSSSHGVCVSLLFLCQDGSTALMFASEHGHEEIVRKLLSHEGCDIDIKDTVRGVSCLSCTQRIRSARTTTVLVLVHSVGVDVNHIAQHVMLDQGNW